MRFLAFLALVMTIFLATTAMAEETSFDLSATTLNTHEEKVSWHGYYEFEYWDEEDKNRTFDAHKITVWMGVKLGEKAFLSSEVEYEHGPDLSDEERPGGKGEVKLDSAQVRITPIENSVIYAGIFYAPFGIEYFSYPGHKNKLVTRPKVMKGGGIIPGTWSDVGVGVTQSIDDIGEIDLYYINGDAFNGGVNRDSSEGGNDGKSFGARVMFDKLLPAHNFGLSYVSGKWDENDKYESTRFGAHVQVETSFLTGADVAPTLIAEYVTGTDEGASAIEGEDKEVAGYYIQLSSSVHPVIEVALRYGEYDDDKKVNGNNKTETSIGAVWHLYEFVRLKAEYQWNGEDGTDKNNNAAVVQLVANW